MRYTINVTEENIREGQKAIGLRSCNCPVAKAFIDAGFSWADVGPGSVELFDAKNTQRWIRFPPEVTQKIIQLDREQPVSPFTFTIEF